MGDGGILLTQDEGIAEHARVLRNYGEASKYEHVEAGLNSRLDEMQAAILRSALLPRLDGWLTRRRQIAAHYIEGLSGGALRPIEAAAGSSAHHLFPVEIIEGDSAEVAEGIAEQGVAVGRHYPLLCPDQPAAQGRGAEPDPLVVARRIAQRQLSLPIHPFLGDGEVEAVVAACRRVGG
jgi:dTDP-4-amino-4,6-dideoxygalactose transaminase